MTTVSKSYESSGDPVIDYCTKLTIKMDPLQEELQTETLARHERKYMLGGAEVFMIGQSFLDLIHGKNVLDIGTFTGASALAWALAIPQDGKVISMDVDHSALNDIGRPIIEKNREIEKKIDFRLGSAIETLDKLIAEGKCGQFDLAFIDADKENYSNYYEKSMELLRKGGVILVDNALWNGAVARGDQDAATKAIDECNRRIFSDENSNSFLINAGDGLHVAFKK